MSGSEGTLGFFSMGIPVLFLRSDLLARLDESVWSYPDPQHIPPMQHELRDPATIRHEIRHFHDCLLTPFLFRRFILEIQRNYISMQLLSAARRSERKLSGTEDLDPESMILLQAHFDAIREYKSAYELYERPRAIHALDLALSVPDLLEASAILVETQYVAHTFGAEAARLYWRGVDTRLSPRYTKLIRLANRAGELCLTQASRLHHLIIASLYSGTNPTQEFEGLLSVNGNRLPDATPAATARLRETMEANMASEAFAFVGLEDDIEGLWELEPARLASLREAKKYFVFPSELLRARRQMLAEYGKMSFDLATYVEQAERLPVPPTCFFPDDEMMIRNVLPFARKEDLRKHYGDVYSIACKRDATRRTTISAGLVPTPGFQSFIALNKVDTMLASRYITQGLFSEHITYNAEMDRVYEMIARTAFG